MVTTVLDAACKPVVAQHFDELESALRERGLRGGVKLMQVDGGFVSVTEAANAPIKMFNSGPAGGVEARGSSARSSASPTSDRRHGRHELRRGGDHRREIAFSPRAEVGASRRRLRRSTSLDRRRRRLDRVDVDGGLIRVGPKSAGSIPGRLLRPRRQGARR